MTQNKSSSRAHSLKLYKISQIHLLNTRQICMYIKKLHQIIRTQQTQLQKLKKRSLKSQVKEKNEEKTIEIPKIDEDEEREKKVSSFLDDIKSAATEGWIQQMGMIYEPTSGMYYHPTTGYYYNAQYNLYYDGNTGNYLTYNEQTFAYEFYCKADTVAETKTDTRDKSTEKAKHSRERERDRKRASRSDSESLDEFGRVRRSDRDKGRHRSRSSSVERRHRRRRYRSKSHERRRRSSSGDDSGDRRRRRRKSRSPKRRRRHEKRRHPSKSPSEEGELSAKTTSDESNEELTRKKVDNDVVEFRHPRKDIAAKYPPSLRLIVQETDLNQEKLKSGSLFIIPYTGGSLGREGSHDIIIPDVNVSKSHLKFTYNRDKDRYECQDTGSRNGTLLNGKRMSDPGVKSKHMSLPHDTVIELNKTKILCHIHEGHTTCDKCEPGIVQKATTTAATVTPAMEVLSHKAALKQLQKRYGLENEKYIEDPKDASSSNASYKDRADTRRKTVGSSHHTEKTVVASVDTSISSDNKGFKMLSKLGWSEGKSLGKGDTGLLEPIPIVSNDGTKGLGCEQPLIGPIQIGAKNKRKAAILAKTQKRFAESGTTVDSD